MATITHAAVGGGTPQRSAIVNKSACSHSVSLTTARFLTMGSKGNAMSRSPRLMPSVSQETKLAALHGNKHLQEERCSCARTAQRDRAAKVLPVDGTERDETSHCRTEAR
jgi:hypothetical protein